MNSTFGLLKSLTIPGWVGSKITNAGPLEASGVQNNQIHTTRREGSPSLRGDNRQRATGKRTVDPEQPMHSKPSKIARPMRKRQRKPKSRRTRTTMETRETYERDNTGATGGGRPKGTTWGPEESEKARKTIFSSQFVLLFPLFTMQRLHLLVGRVQR